MSTKVKSIKKSLLLRISGFWCKKPDHWNLNRIFFSKCNFADCEPLEGNQMCSYGDTPFRYSRSIILINNFLNFWNFGLSRIWFKDQYQWFFSRIFLSWSKVFTWHFDWWSQTWSCWENSVWTMRCINNHSISQNFRSMGIVTQNPKPSIFKSSALLQVEQFEWGLNERDEFVI